MSKKVILIAICLFAMNISINAKDNQHEIESIKQYNKSGVYIVKENNNEVKYTAIKNKVNTMANIKISAKDFVYNAKSLDDLSDNEIIALAQAKAIDTKTNQKLPLRVVKANSQCVFDCEDEFIKVIFVSDTASNTVVGYDAKVNKNIVDLEQPVLEIPKTNESSASSIRREQVLDEKITYVNNNQVNEENWNNTEKYNELENNPVKSIAKRTTMSVVMGLPLLILYGQYNRVSRRVKKLIEMFLK